MNETWKPVLGYEDCYEISNFGVVRSITRYNPKSNRWYESRIMKTRLDKDGYVIVGLTKDGKMKMNKVHRLVISTFTNEDLDLQVNHIDGNKQNNNLDNLEWCTCSENQLHAHKIGLKSQQGRKNNASKLTEQDVIEICDFFRYTKFKVKEIAELYGVKPNTITNIKTRRQWKHVTDNIEF
jgi:hypothetical protein